jgi:hypothetical protein
MIWSSSLIKEIMLNLDLIKKKFSQKYEYRKLSLLKNIDLLKICLWILVKFLSKKEKKKSEVVSIFEKINCELSW